MLRTKSTRQQMILTVPEPAPSRRRVYSSFSYGVVYRLFVMRDHGGSLDQKRSEGWRERESRSFQECVFVLTIHDMTDKQEVGLFMCMFVTTAYDATVKQGGGASLGRVFVTTV